jgi:hypothetical protein
MGAERLLGVGRHDDARHGILAVDAVAGDQLGQDHGALLGGIDQPHGAATVRYFQACRTGRRRRDRRGPLPRHRQQFLIAAA